MVSGRTKGEAKGFVCSSHSHWSVRAGLSARRHQSRQYPPNWTGIGTPGIFSSTGSISRSTWGDEDKHFLLQACYSVREESQRVKTFLHLPAHAPNSAAKRRNEVEHNKFPHYWSKGKWNAARERNKSDIYCHAGNARQPAQFTVVGNTLRYQKSTKETQGENTVQVASSGTCPQWQYLGARSWMKKVTQLSRDFLQSCLLLPNQERESRHLPPTETLWICEKKGIWQLWEELAVGRLRKIKPQMRENWGQIRNRCALKIEGQEKDRCKGPCK